MSKKRNAIWIFSDQQPAHMLSCNGNPNLNTPNLDRLAVEGVNCTQAVSGFPLCCPFRGSLLTSQYPHKCVPGHEYQMPPVIPTVAETFKQNGFHTAYFGKWHLDGFKEGKNRAAMHIVPPERRGGFDRWIGFENNNSQYDCWVHGGDGDETEQFQLPGYETDCLTDLLINYIKEQAQNPEQNFFSVLSVQPPHNPYVAPPEFMQHHNPAKMDMRPNVPNIPRIQEKARRNYAGACAMVENLDWNVGRVMKALQESGLTRDTHIIFFSDHGDMHGSQGQFLKTTSWEEAIRIPCIIGGAEAFYDMKSHDSDVVINHVDIAPTTIGLCGLDVPDYMEGYDYSGLRLKEKPIEDAPDSAYLQQVIPTCHGYSVDRPWRGIVTRDGWKYIAHEGQDWQLFNLNEDPYEQVNHATNSVFWEKRRELNNKLREWVKKTGDEFNLPPAP